MTFQPDFASRTGGQWHYGDGVQIELSADRQLAYGSARQWEVDPQSSGLAMVLPDARTLLTASEYWFRVPADAAHGCDVEDYDSGTVDTLAPGDVRGFLLFDNSTAAGSWAPLSGTTAVAPTILSLLEAEGHMIFTAFANDVNRARLVHWFNEDVADGSLFDQTGVEGLSTDYSVLHSSVVNPPTFAGSYYSWGASDDAFEIANPSGWPGTLTGNGRYSLEIAFRLIDKATAWDTNDQFLHPNTATDGTFRLAIRDTDANDDANTRQVITCMTSIGGNNVFTTTTKIRNDGLFHFLTITTNTGRPYKTYFDGVETSVNFTSVFAGGGPIEPSRVGGPGIEIAYVAAQDFANFVDCKAGTLGANMRHWANRNAVVALKPGLPFAALAAGCPP